MIVLIPYTDLLNLSWIKMSIFEEYGPLKMLSKFEVDDILKLLLLFFRENQVYFIWIVCQADDSPEMSSLIFFQTIF